VFSSSNCKMYFGKLQNVLIAKLQNVLQRNTKCSHHRTTKCTLGDYEISPITKLKNLLQQTMKFLLSLNFKIFFDKLWNFAYRQTSKYSSVKYEVSLIIKNSIFFFDELNNLWHQRTNNFSYRRTHLTQNFFSKSKMNLDHWSQDPMWYGSLISPNFTTMMKGWNSSFQGKFISTTCRLMQLIISSMILSVNLTWFCLEIWGFLYHFTNFPNFDAD
jgi:hypothetical protein